MKTIIVYSFKNDHNYDSVKCELPDMVALCGDIKHNVVDGQQMIIAHNAAVNSQAVCVFAPLQAGTLIPNCQGKIGCCWKNLMGIKPFSKPPSYWFCADSTGAIGVTEADPATPGYCVDGQSAQCPPIID